MMAPWQWKLVILVAFCLIGRVSRAEDIMVRLINVRNGEPIIGRVIWLDLKEDRVRNPKATLEARTGADGVATFHLNAPLPPHIFVYVASGDIKSCGPGGFSTEEVVRKGVVAEKGKCDPKGKLNGKFSPRPGEIIDFGQIRRWWERGIT